MTRAAVLEGRLADYRAAPTTAHAAAAVAAAGSDARALAARAATRVQAATAIGWRTGTQAEARALLGGAIRDLRGALTTTPTDATYHEQLGSALAARARLEGDVNDGSQAMAHFKRAIALAPEDATLYVSLSRFAATQRPPLWDVAFDASRAAVRRDPRLLEALLDEPAFIGLGDDQWLALVPPLFPERLRLALLLEARSQLIPATRVARAALEVATGKHDQAVGGWALARLLLLRGEIEGALGAIATALAADAANPELYVVYGHALRAHGDPRCLDAYRHAVAAVATVMRREGKLAPFSLADVRLRALVDERVGTSPLKYRAVLASYFGDRGLSEQAIDEWLAIVAENGGDGQARFALASVLDSAGHSERALDQYRQAVALDGRPVYRARFAQRLWDSEQYYQAIAQWIEIRQRKPRNLDVRLALARAYVRVGERADALREYQAVLGIDAAHPAARREIEQLGRGGR